MHVAIIPDGNRRWAKEKGLVGSFGHKESVQGDRVEAFLKKAIELKIEYVSIWVFSTDNWKRSEAEKQALFKLLLVQVEELRAITDEHSVRVRSLGRKDRMPDDIKKVFTDIEEQTKNNSRINMQLCFDYGGRDEILRAVNQAVKDGKEVTEETFSQLLDTKDIPDPDLIIRTSGEQRLSGLFPWQSTYAELYFTDKHFPDFGPEDLETAITAFKNRQQRHGGD